MMRGGERQKCMVTHCGSTYAHSLQVQMLQEQVGHLAESQANTDDRYSKVKQENASLTQK